MEAAVSQHLEQDGMLARPSGHADPQIGLGLGEVQPLAAVREDRGAGVLPVQAAGVDLSDVGDEVSLDAAGLGHERSEPSEQLLVRQLSEFVGTVHAPKIGGVLATADVALWTTNAGRRVESVPRHPILENT